MKKIVFLPFLLVASLFMAFYVMDVQAQSTSGAAPSTAAPSTTAASPAAGGAAMPRTLAAPACSGFYGTMKATNWPGGKLTLTCPGKNRMRGKCVGASAQLSPGQSFSFNNCNCLDPKSKCLTVSNMPPGCKVKSKLACASNRESVDGSFQVECSPSASGSPSPCPSGGTVPSDIATNQAAPSDVLPSDILPSNVLPSDDPLNYDPPVGGVSPEASGMEPSFVCLILGADGRCAEPTAGPDPCAPNAPSDALPSDTTFIPSDAVPSDAFVPAP